MISRDGVGCADNMIECCRGPSAIGMSQFRESMCTLCERDSHSSTLTDNLQAPAQA
jgi:hypothetical protein